MRHHIAIRVGPVGFRIGADWAAPIARLADLYDGYPVPALADHHVRLSAPRPWRRVVRPTMMIDGDYSLPGTAPLPLAHGLLAAEMGMNLQLALGHRRHLLIHASVVERDGRALLMTGESGAGKSTLSALLTATGWRFMGDEFALIDPVTGMAMAFPRLVSLKNEGIAAARSGSPAARFGPLLAGTPKGDIRHMVPPADAIAAMDRPARPALILFPRFGFAPSVRPVPVSETFVRLTQASTNFTLMGERGFTTLTRLVRDVPAVAIDYPDTATALALIDSLWPC